MNYSKNYKIDFKWQKLELLLKNLKKNREKVSFRGDQYLTRFTRFQIKKIEETLHSRVSSICYNFQQSNNNRINQVL